MKFFTGIISFDFVNNNERTKHSVPKYFTVLNSSKANILTEVNNNICVIKKNGKSCNFLAFSHRHLHPTPPL